MCRGKRDPDSRKGKDGTKSTVDMQGKVTVQPDVLHVCVLS